MNEMQLVTMSLAPGRQVALKNVRQRTERRDFTDLISEILSNSEKTPAPRRDEKKANPAAELAAMMAAGQSTHPNTEAHRAARTEGAISATKFTDDAEGLSALPDMDVNVSPDSRADLIALLRQAMDEIARRAGYENAEDMLTHPHAMDGNEDEYLKAFSELIDRLLALRQEERPANTGKEETDALREALLQALTEVSKNPNDLKAVEKAALFFRLTRVALGEGQVETRPAPEELSDAETLEKASARLTDVLPHAVSEETDRSVRAGVTEKDGEETVAFQHREQPATDSVFSLNADRTATAPTATAVADTQRAAPPRPAALAEQLIQSVRVGQAQGATEMKLLLNPEFLGRVSIVLSSGADGLKARITAQSEAARALLADNLSQLSERFRAAGIDMRSIEITQSDLGWEYARGDGGQSAPRQPQEGLEDSPRVRTRRLIALMDTSIPQTEVYERSAVSLAADGGVEYFA